MTATSTISSPSMAMRSSSTAIDRGRRRNEVAAILGQSPRTVDRLIAAGRLTAVHPLGRGVGKPVFITEESLQQFIETAPQRVAAPPSGDPDGGVRTERERVLDQLEACVARVIATAPPLSVERRERLAAILGGGTR